MVMNSPARQSQYSAGRVTVEDHAWKHDALRPAGEVVKVVQDDAEDLHQGQRRYREVHRPEPQDREAQGERHDARQQASRIPC